MRAVGFDFDGTLFDSGYSIVSSFTDACNELGLAPPSAERLVPLIGRSLHDIIKELAFENCELDTMVDTYRRCHINHIAKVTMFDGVKQCLEDLKRQGVRIAIVTTRYSQSVDLILKENGLERSYFDCVITGDMCVNLKPHPEPIEKAMLELNVKAHEFCYVGDRDVDRDAALAASTQFFAVGWGNSPFEDELPTNGIKLSTPDELAPTVLKFRF